MRSVATAALCLAILHTSDARVAHSFRHLIQRDAQPGPQSHEGIFEWFARLLKRTVQPRQDDSTCYEDDYYVFVGSPSLGEGFCQDYMNYPNRTVPVEATATSTLTTTYTTDIDTITEYTRATPASTLTETVTAASAKFKRNGDAQITARAVLNRKQAFQLYRRQTNATANDNDMASAFSSACNCHDYNGPVVSETYTGQTAVRTLKAFGNADTTITRTQTAAPSITTTTTTMVAASSAASTTSTSVPQVSSQAAQSPSTTLEGNPSSPTPTAPAFTCPEDHNTTVSQMVGSERFDYLVLCDTVLMDADIYSGALSYKSFSECVGACSIADQQFDNPVCQGVSFYATDAAGSGNCFLKGAANHSVLAVGVDSALLQRILVGITNDTVQGTATELLPFAGIQPTVNPSQFSSMISSVLSNSSNSMPMVTPMNSPPMSGRQVGPITAYSTYVSDGSTYSSGTGYTTVTTFANGSWVSAYYNTYTMTWASAATVYALSEGGSEFENATTFGSSKTNGENGQYGIINTWNTTYSNGSNQAVIQTISYEANGNPFYSTATTYFTAATGAADGGAGGAGGSAPVSAPAGPLITPAVSSNNGSLSGGEAGGAQGGPGSGGPGLVTSTSRFSTQSVITLPGGNTGGAQSGYGAGGPPLTYTGVSTIVNNGSTAYETYYIVSGGPTGTEGANSVINSGGPSPVTVISTGERTGGGASGIVSGGPGNTGAASSSIISGRPSSSPSPYASSSIVTVISNSGATDGGTGAIISGGPMGTGVANSSPTSGGPSPNTNTTSPLTASFTGDNRSPGYEESSSTSVPLPTAPSGGIYSPRESPSGSAPGTVPPSNATAPQGTSPLTASFTGDNRSPGSESSSTPMPLLTAPSAGFYPPPVFTAPTGTSSLTASFTRDNRSGDYGVSSSQPTGNVPGTAPLGTSPPGTSLAPGVPIFHGPNQTVPAPSGTAPMGTQPGPSRSPPTNTAPATSVLIPTGISPASFSNTIDSRLPGTESSSVPHPYPSLTFPTAQSSCANGTMGTTTLFSTTTVYGCYSTCLPSWGGPAGWGGYGGPHAFGPPVETAS